MKLHEIHNIDILWTGELDGEDVSFYVERLSEGRQRAGFARNSKGGLVAGVMKWVKNPVVAAVAASYAVSAYKNYQKNKRYTTSFFAKSQEERKLYKSIVADLMATGKYKKVREKHVDGGILYVLRKLK